MQRLLVDELTGDEVILAPARALRPDTFRVDAAPLPKQVATCPFCAGNEHETPPEVDRRGGGAPDTPGWTARVVPNKYPIVGDGVAGVHEVVIFSPAHDVDFGGLSPAGAADALTLMRDRARALTQRGCRYVQTFVNQGKAAGASIEHPHAQLVGLDAVPPRARTRLARFDPAAFARDRAHLVADADAVVWCPRASTTPFAVRVAPRDGRARFADAPDAEVAATGRALRSAIRALQQTLGAVAYNAVVETAPARDDAFRWWIDLLPRLTVTAGFELGTGVWVNIVDPADAAATLRDALAS